MAAKKTKKGPAAGKKRKRRSSEEIIQDLQEEIRRVRARQKQKELKSSPSMKAAMGAIKALDKTLDAAADDGNANLRHIAAEARKTLGAFLEKEGMALPKANMPKGRKPRSLQDV